MSRKKKKKPQITLIPDNTSFYVRNNSTHKHKNGPSPIEIVKEILCGSPKDNPKPLTLRVCVRRFFIVLDNLIAAVLLFYFFTWMKFYSNGAETSFDVIIDDMTTLCVNNVVGFFILLGVTWRELYYSDSLPCMINLTYKLPYQMFVMLVFGLSAGYFAYWLRMFVAYCFDIDAMFKPIGDEECHQNPMDFLPYWAQEIRIVVFCGVTTIRKFFLDDIDMYNGDKIGWFEKKAPKAQPADAPKTTESVSGEEPKEEGCPCGDQRNL